MITQAKQQELVAKARAIHAELNELCEEVDLHSVSTSVRSYDDIRNTVGELCDRLRDVIWDLNHAIVDDGIQPPFSDERGRK